jgi:hypothetical protein
MGESVALEPLRDCSTGEMLGKSLGNTSQTSCFVRIVPHSSCRPLVRRSPGPRRLEEPALVLPGSPARGTVHRRIGPPHSLGEPLGLLQPGPRPYHLLRWSKPAAAPPDVDLAGPPWPDIGRPPLGQQ